jgi:hypothetical protein
MGSENWTRENIIWLAGLMEGEGAFFIRRREPKRRDAPAVALQMCDRDVVVRAREIAGVGGAICLGDRAKHYPNKGWKDIWHWRVQKVDDAIALMWALYPWMGERRQQQIRDCLAVWSSTQYRVRRSA